MLTVSLAEYVLFKTRAGLLYSEYIAIIFNAICCRFSSAVPIEKNSSCAPNPCENGGLCSIVNGAAVCACPEGFLPPLCELKGNVRRTIVLEPSCGHDTPLA